MTQQDIPSPIASELFIIRILLHESVNILQEQATIKKDTKLNLLVWIL